jgi:hypothetical protein
MPNPSTAQVVEFREQIAPGNDAGGVTVTVCGHWSCFGTKWQYRWAEISVGSKPDLIFVGDLPIGASKTNSLWCNYSTRVLDGLFGELDHWRRGRCPFPSELTGTCRFDLRLPIKGS